MFDRATSVRQRGLCPTAHPYLGSSPFHVTKVVIRFALSDKLLGLRLQKVQ
jgi:hypothetical protein